jgi:hemoglobin-like flavoprotein
MILSEHQIWLVQTSFEKFIVDIDVASRVFYDHLFEIQPALMPMFKGDTRVQGRKLITMILFIVNGLDDLDSLLPQIQMLGETHVGYGVKAQDYNTMLDALVATLKHNLGREFTPETEGAWRAVYRLMAETAIQSGFTKQPTD